MCGVKVPYAAATLSLFRAMQCLYCLDDHDLSGSTFAWALDGERTVCVNDNDHSNNDRCMMKDEEHEDQRRRVQIAPEGTRSGLQPPASRP